MSVPLCKIFTRIIIINIFNIIIIIIIIDNNNNNSYILRNYPHIQNKKKLNKINTAIQ